MFERSSASWYLRQGLGRGVAGVLLFAAGCAPGEAPPNPNSSGSSGGRSSGEDCFIPANQRAALPEQLAREIEARCESPAIPRRIGGTVGTPIPDQEWMGRDPKIRIATPTPEIPEEADRLREALEAIKTIKISYKDFSERAEAIINVEYVRDGDYKYEGKLKSIKSGGQLENASYDFIKAGGRFWKKREDDKSWEETGNVSLEVDHLLSAYVHKVINSVEERKFEKKPSQDKNTEAFFISYPASRAPAAGSNVMPRNANKENLTLVVDARTYLPIALRVEDFDSANKLVREVIAEYYDHNKSFIITPPVRK